MKQASETRSETTDATAEAAARWFARRRQGLIPHEDAAFTAWLEAGPDHRRAYDRVTRAWEMTGAAAVDPAIAAMRSEALMLRPEPRPRIRLLAGSLAAALVMAVGGGYWLAGDGNPPTPVQAASIQSRLIQTAVGERTTVTLDDGSVVTLNTASQLRIGFTAARRDVTLLAGQALFHVAKDSNRPFVVTAGDRQVVAVGTEFEVRITKAGMRVALLEGRVKVQPLPRGDPAGAPSSPAPIATLEPGEQLVVAPSGRVSIKAMDVGELVGWREGRVRFDETPLGEAVAEMNRYSLKPIVIADPRIASIRVSGAFRTGQSSSFVAAITEVFPVQAETDNDAIRLRQTQK